MEGFHACNSEPLTFMKNSKSFLMAILSFATLLRNTWEDFGHEKEEKKTLEEIKNLIADQIRLTRGIQNFIKVPLKTKKKKKVAN